MVLQIRNAKQTQVNSWNRKPTGREEFMSLDIKVLSLLNDWTDRERRKFQNLWPATVKALLPVSVWALGIFTNALAKLLNGGYLLHRFRWVPSSVPLATWFQKPSVLWLSEGLSTPSSRREPCFQGIGPRSPQTGTKATKHEKSENHTLCVNLKCRQTKLILHKSWQVISHVH